MPGRNRAPLLNRRRLVVGLPAIAAAGAAAAAALRLDRAAFSQRQGATGTAYPAPPGRRLPGPPELGVYVGNEPHRVAQFERWLGRRVDGVLGYTAGETWGDIADPGWAIEMWRPIDRPIFWSIPLIPNDRRSLARAVTGAFDHHWWACAQRLAAFRPQDARMHIRTGWECNTGDFPWAAKGREAAFIGAFRRFADTFRAVSPRFMIEWNCNHTGELDPEKAWPGADWVDVIGMDFYWNPQWTARDPVRAWEWMLDQPRGLRWHQAFAAAQGRPTAYSEWGVTTNEAGPYLERAKAWFDSHDVLFHTYWDADSAFPGRLSNGARPRSAAAFTRLFSGGPSGQTIR